MNQNRYQEEVEIDLIQFCKRLLVQWRAIVAVSLVFGFLVVIGKNVEDNRAYHASVDSSKIPELTVNDIKESLTEEEIDAVYLALDTQRQIDAKETYLEDSIYMNLEPQKCKKVCVWYRIDTDNTTDACDVAYVYKVLLNSDETISFLKNKLGLDCEVTYARELYTRGSAHNDFAKRQTDYIYLQLYLPQGVEEQTAVIALKDTVESISDVREQYTYNIQYAYETIDALSLDEERSLQESQIEQRNSLTSLHKEQKETVEAFSDMQNKLYQMSIQNDILDDIGSISEEKMVPSSSVNAKYFAIGVLVGILLYVGLFFAYIIFNARAVELSVAGVTMMPCLGVLKDNKPRKKNFLSFFIYDQLVYNLLYKEQEKQLSKPENIIGRMKIYAGEEEMTQCHILQPGLDEADSIAMRDLREKAAVMGIDIKVMPVEVSDISDMISKLNTNTPTVVSIYESKTKKKDISALYEILKNQKVNVLGELYVR